MRDRAFVRARAQQERADLDPDAEGASSGMREWLERVDRLRAQAVLEELKQQGL